MATTRASRRAASRQRPSTPRRVSSRAPRLRQTLLCVLLLAGAATWAYSTSFAGVFVFDDKFGIVQNPNVRALWPLTRSMWAPPELPVTARPVASLSLALNHAMASPDVRDVMAPGRPGDSSDTSDKFLRNVWGYHFLNLLLHVLAAAALFGVVRRTLASERLRAMFGPQATALAFVVALVWVVHPLTTDAVTYVVQRTEVLMGLFYLCTLYCAIRAGERRTTGTARAWWTAGAIAACALGVGSKQTMVTAPLVVWLWDWFFRPASEAADMPAGSAPQARRTGLYAGLAATWLILAVLVAVERWPHSVGFNREGWTPWTYLLTQTGVIVHYVKLSFVPAPLAIDYDGWPMAHGLLEVWPYAVCLALAFGATAFALARRQPWGFAGAWFFALLAPSSSVLPLATEVVAERRMYLPLAAVIVTAVIGAYLLAQRMLVRGSKRSPASSGVWGFAAIVVVGTVAITFGALTRERNSDYWSEERIWSDTVAKRPANPRARANYGVILLYEGRTQEAEQQLREAVRLKDTSAAAHSSLGTLLCATGRLDECMAHLERAVALDPDYKDAYGSLGEAYAAQGRRALAIKYFALAVDAAPENPFLLNRLGWLLATAVEDDVRNGARAVEVAERSVRLTSRRDLMSLETLAAAYAEAGRFDDAVATAREAVAAAERTGNPAAVARMSARLSQYERRERVRQ